MEFSGFIRLLGYFQGSFLNGNFQLYRFHHAPLNDSEYIFRSYLTTHKRFNNSTEILKIYLYLYFRGNNVESQKQKRSTHLQTFHCRVDSTLYKQPSIRHSSRKHIRAAAVISLFPDNFGRSLPEDNYPMKLDTDNRATETQGV